jgi:hypothetical protein
MYMDVYICKGEVLDSHVWERVEATKLDCLRASLKILTAHEVAARDTWYLEAFDSWMHQKAFRTHVQRQVVGARLKFVCASYYDVAVKSVAPVVVKGAAKMLLSSIKAAADASALSNSGQGELLRGELRGELRGDTPVVAGVQNKNTHNGGGAASSPTKSLQFSPTNLVGVVGGGRGGGASRAVQSSGKVVGAAGGECKKGKEKELPKYMVKLSFLKAFRQAVWPRVEPVHILNTLNPSPNPKP